MKWKMIALLLVVMVGLGASAVVFATQPLSTQELTATLIPEQGTVEMKHVGTDQWIVVERNTIVVAGDEVRTGVNSEASINFFDQGIARLASNTTITIAEARVDDASSTFTGRVMLQGGKVWSKLLDFLSPNSVYNVETASSVATVRGTSFFVQSDGARKERFFVDSHRVDVFGEGQEVRVDEGNSMQWEITDNIAKPLFGNEAGLPDDDRAWVKDVRASDKKFLKDVRNRNVERLKELSSVRKNGGLDKLIDAAETIRLAATLDNQTKDQLAERFALRKFAVAELAVMQGDAKSPSQREQALRGLRGGLSEEGRRSMGVMLRAMVHQDEDAQVPEDLWKELGERLPEEGNMLDFVTNRRALFRDLIKSEPTLDQPLELRPLTDTTTLTPQPLEIRPTTIAPKPMLAPTPVTQPVAGTTTIAPSTATTTQPVPVVPTELRLVADKINLKSGQTSMIHAWLVMNDGTQKDVTKDVVWSATPDDLSGDVVGGVQDGLFTATSNGGKTTVRASIRSSEKEFSATIQMTVFVIAM